MQVWVKKDDGTIIATYVNGKLNVGTMFDPDVLAYHLFKMQHELLSRGGGSTYGGALGAQRDDDFGTAENPDA